MKKAYIAIMVLILILAGCGAKESIGETAVRAGEVTGNEQNKPNIPKPSGTLKREAIEGLEEGLACYYLTCEDKSDPLIQYILEEEWGGYGGGSSGATIKISEYWHPSLKQYVMSLQDNQSKGESMAVTGHFEEYGKLIIDIEHVEVEVPKQASNIVNFVFVVERPINQVVVYLDGEEVLVQDAPYFGMSDSKQKL